MRRSMPKRRTLPCPQSLRYGRFATQRQKSARRPSEKTSSRRSTLSPTLSRRWSPGRRSRSWRSSRPHARRPSAGRGQERSEAPTLNGSAARDPSVAIGIAGIRPPDKPKRIARVRRGSRAGRAPFGSPASSRLGRAKGSRRRPPKPRHGQPVGTRPHLERGQVDATGLLGLVLIAAAPVVAAHVTHREENRVDRPTPWLSGLFSAGSATQRPSGSCAILIGFPDARRIRRATSSRMTQSSSSLVPDPRIWSEAL